MNGYPVLELRHIEHAVEPICGARGVLGLRDRLGLMCVDIRGDGKGPHVLPAVSLLHLNRVNGIKNQ